MDISHVLVLWQPWKVTDALEKLTIDERKECQYSVRMLYDALPRQQISLPLLFSEKHQIWEVQFLGAPFFSGCVPWRRPRRLYNALLLSSNGRKRIENKWKIAVRHISRMKGFRIILFHCAGGAFAIFCIKKTRSATPNIPPIRCGALVKVFFLVVYLFPFASKKHLRL